MKKLMLLAVFAGMFVSGVFARDIITFPGVSHWRSCDILPDNTIRSVYVEYTTDRTPPILFYNTYRKELLNGVDGNNGWRHIFTTRYEYAAEPAR